MIATNNQFKRFKGTMIAVIMSFLKKNCIFLPYFGTFSIKIYNQRQLTKAFKIEALEQRHKCIPMGMRKAPGGIVTGFEVVIQVFDGRIVLRNYGVHKSSQTQTFSNKASFLCPQECVLLKNALEVFIWDQESPMRHSICNYWV